MNQSKQYKTLFKQKKKILITTHVRPDADAIGSSLALFMFLRHQGHDCMLSFPTSFASLYNWFPNIHEVVLYENHKEKVIEFHKTCDLIMVVDFNQLSRNGELGEILANSETPKFLIDHHTSPDDIFDYQIWDTRFSAAAEGVFNFIETIDSQWLYDKAIATCLYAAIVADSGSFRFQSVGPNTHKIASKLLESGINHTKIHQRIYDNFTEGRLKLWGYCLYEKLKYVEGYPVAYICLSYEEFKNLNGKNGDTEGLVNLPLAIENIEISTYIVEKEDIVKLSFRSKDHIGVNEFAREFFNGGGHFNAAGGESTLTLEETEMLFVEKVKTLFPKIQ